VRTCRRHSRAKRCTRFALRVVIACHALLGRVLKRRGSPTPLKLPHHGSNNNMEPNFFERIVADHYVIAADGIRHHHPSEETLEALVASRHAADTFTIHLTNEIDFASTRPAALRAGRAFIVRTRALGEPVIRIELP